MEVLDNQLTLHPEQARFPARCVSCGAQPSAEIVIETWKGIDLLYFAWGHTCEIAVPSCAGCVSRRRIKRAAFLLASLASVLVFIVGGAFTIRASPVMPLVVIPGAIAGIWFLRRGELNLYHRWFSPIWLSRWRPKENLDTCRRSCASPARPA